MERNDSIRVGQCTFVFCMVLAACQSGAPAPGAAERAVAASDAHTPGMLGYIDPATGRIAPAPSQASVALPSAARAAATPALIVEPSPVGGNMLRLPEQFQTTLRADVSGGTISGACNGAANAEEP